MTAMRDALFRSILKRWNRRGGLGRTSPDMPLENEERGELDCSSGEDYVAQMLSVESQEARLKE